MKMKQAIVGIASITLVYLVVLIWADSKNQVFNKLPVLANTIPFLMALSLSSYLIRYLRWRWLLYRAGNSTSFCSGFVAYLAGFAFTATPGKVGELVRIRYFGLQGVPAHRVIAAFIYERAFDLIAVLLLAALAISRIDLFLFVASFVCIFLTVIVVSVANARWLNRFAAILRYLKFFRISRLARVLTGGLSGCRIWLTPIDACLSLILGLGAWLIPSLSFVLLLKQMEISIPGLSAMAIYPLAMLTGAVSMLPGGLGSTEAAIIAMLSLFGVSIGIATVVAIGIRLSSLWFAVICGLIALSTLEVKHVTSRAHLT